MKQTRLSETSSWGFIAQTLVPVWTLYHRRWLINNLIVWRSASAHITGQKNPTFHHILRKLEINSPNNQT